MEHLKKDLGQLKKGSTVVVGLRKQANVLLMDSSNYRAYAGGRGGRYRYHGGLVKKSPARIIVPSNGHWILAIDLGGASGRVSATVSVEPPPRGDLPEYRSARGPQGMSGQVSTRRPLPPKSPDEFGGRTWDVFLSHASEDKDAVALPLAQALEDRGVTVWLDKAELRIGDSLRRRIDRGMRSSSFAAVILSEAYFAKGWTQYELDGIVTLSVGGEQNMLPVWHNVDRAAVAAHSPSLADKFARSTSDTEIAAIADEIAELVLSSSTSTPRAPAVDLASNPTPLVVPTTAPADLPPAAASVSDAEVLSAFRSYFAERSAANVMVGRAVTDVSFVDRVVRVTFDPSAAGVTLKLFNELKAFDNLASFSATPIAFNDDLGNRLRPAIAAIETMTPDGASLGTLSAADILALNELSE